MFQKEFDTLKKEIEQGNNINVRDFTDRRNQQSLRNDPFSD